jgi:hypothetical protein
MTENLDAMRAVEHISLSERETFREVLAATLVKHFRHRRAFDTVFDVYFALHSSGIDDDGEGGDGADGESREESGGVPGQQGSGGSGEGMSNEERAEMLLSALMNMDREQLRQLASLAVQPAGMEPGAPSAVPTTSTALRCSTRRSRQRRWAGHRSGTRSRRSMNARRGEESARLKELGCWSRRRSAVDSSPTAAWRPWRTLRFPKTSSSCVAHEMQRSSRRDPLTRSQRASPNVAVVATGSSRLPQDSAASLSYGGASRTEVPHPHPSKPE